MTIIYQLKICGENLFSRSNGLITNYIFLGKTNEIYRISAPYGCEINSDEMSCFEKIRNVTVLIDQAEEYNEAGEIDPVENVNGSAVFVWVHSYDCSAGSG